METTGMKPTDVESGWGPSVDTIEFFVVHKGKGVTIKWTRLSHELVIDGDGGSVYIPLPSFKKMIEVLNNNGVI